MESGKLYCIKAVLHTWQHKVREKLLNVKLQEVGLGSTLVLLFTTIVAILQQMFKCCLV